MSILWKKHLLRKTDKHIKEKADEHINEDGDEQPKEKADKWIKNEAEKHIEKEDNFWKHIDISNTRVIHELRKFNYITKWELPPFKIHHVRLF